MRLVHVRALGSIGWLVCAGCTDILGTFERVDGGEGGGGPASTTSAASSQSASGTGGGTGSTGSAGGGGGSGGGSGGSGGVDPQPSGPCGYGCDGLDADCDGAEANGFEADLRADPANCGACGIFCPTGACVDGACSPITVWSGAELPHELRLDESLVYFLLTDSVVGMTKDGGALSTYAEAESTPQSLALDPGNLYWVAAGSEEIRKVSKTGGGVTSIVAEPFVDRIAIDGASLYWTTAGDPGAAVPYSDGTVRKAALDGSGESTVASSQPKPSSIAADAGRLAWGTTDPDDPCLGDLSFLDSGEETPISLSSVSTSRLDLAGDMLVYTTTCTPNVYAVSVVGGAAIDHYYPPNALDGDNVSVGLYFNLVIVRPLRGGEIMEVMDTGATGPILEMAIDDTSLFYAGVGAPGYVIRRVEKPFGMRKVGACELGTADCNGDDDDGCEVDLWYDPDNCGFCGRSCGASDCSTSCVPEEEFSSASAILGGVVRGDHLYLAESTGITRIPLTGGAAEEVSTAVTPSAGIAVDATHAYVANLGTNITKVQLDDGSSAILGGAPGAVAVALFGGEVFWAGGTTVGKMPAAGGTGDTLAISQESPGGVAGLGGLAVGAEGVYWTVGLSSADAAIMRTGLDGGPVVAVVSDLQGPLTVALDATHLYWSTSTGVFRANFDGSAAKQISWASPFNRGSLQPAPTSLAVDDTHIYWGSEVGGVLWAPKAGGPAQILSGYFAGSSSLAIQSPTKVYWSDGTTVYSTPKL